MATVRAFVLDYFTRNPRQWLRDYFGRRPPVSAEAFAAEILSYPHLGARFVDPKNWTPHDRTNLPCYLLVEGDRFGVYTVTSGSAFCEGRYDRLEDGIRKKAEVLLRILENLERTGNKTGIEAPPDLCSILSPDDQMVFDYFRLGHERWFEAYDGKNTPMRGEDFARRVMAFGLSEAFLDGKPWEGGNWFFDRRGYYLAHEPEWNRYAMYTEDRCNVRLEHTFPSFEAAAAFKADWLLRWLRTPPDRGIGFATE